MKLAWQHTHEIAVGSESTLHSTSPTITDETALLGDMTGKTRQDKTRQDKTRQDKTRQEKTRKDKTRPEKTRKDKGWGQG